MSEELINNMIGWLEAKDDFKTVIIGVIAGTKEEVKQTEQEFHTATNDLLSKNVFIKLSGFKGLIDYRGGDEEQ
ncbi:MAG: hypothetical protein ACTSPB_15555 [Candidatus Thorarchaeota archaeon]